MWTLIADIGDNVSVENGILSVGGVPVFSLQYGKIVAIDVGTKYLDSTSVFFLWAAVDSHLGQIIVVA